MFDFEWSWLDDLRRSRINQSKNELEIVENMGIICLFPQTASLFCSRVRNGVRISGNDEYELSVRCKRGWPARLVLQSLSQYVREKSKLKLDLKLSTWIGAFCICSWERITNLLFVKHRSLRIVGCTWILDPTWSAIGWSSCDENTLYLIS